MKPTMKSVIKDLIIEDYKKTGMINLEKIPEYQKYVVDNSVKLFGNKRTCPPSIKVIIDDVINDVRQPLRPSNLEECLNVHTEIRRKYNMFESTKIASEKRNEEFQKKNKERQKKHKKYGYGIYGIYVEDELIYIGKTIVDFNERFNQHKMAIDNVNNNLPIYKILRTAKKMNRNIYLKPLIDLSILKVEHHNCEFSNKEIECMEMALITILKPKCNVEGIYKPYRFS